MNFPIRQRRAGVLFFLICSTVFVPVQENRGQFPEPDKTTVAVKTKPNIVLMLTDNLGYGELGVYGGGILRGAPTPRIDKLAGEGMRLLNFNVEAQCTPTRSALMTGRFPIRSGTYEVRGVGTPDKPEGLTQWEITLAELLSAQGYATGGANGILAAPKSDSLRIRASTNGTASRAVTPSRCGRIRTRRIACGRRSAQNRAGMRTSFRLNPFSMRARARKPGRLRNWT